MLEEREVFSMYMIEAIVQPHKLEEVRKALGEADIHGMTVSEGKGFGRQRGHTEVYRGAEYVVDFRPKLKLEIAIRDEQVEAALAAIQESAGTGRIGDGKIFVRKLSDAVRIRTGERGDSAL